MVVVIDHQVAHIYHDLGGSRPEDEVSVKPYDPFGFQHHLIHRKEAHYKGDHVPEEDSYYEEIATDLVHAEAIILIGHATGKSSAMEFLSEYLKSHHPETFKRIIATETADLSALTEPEIEAIAKKHLGAPSAVPLRTDWGGLRKEHV
jgi:stalled ribosome rescue protein Dom34